MCRPSDGKEVKDVFGHHSSCVRVYLAHERPLAACGMDAWQMVLILETRQLSLHYVAQILLNVALKKVTKNHPFITLKTVFLTRHTCTCIYLSKFEGDLPQMFCHNCRYAWIKINGIVELWSLTLRISVYFSLSPQIILHWYMDLNESWQECCTSSLEVHVGR